ncbi:hypothetical protein [Enterovibrio norvegicus]|uniref:Uncharacterized protein n=1 Tax=Enterovibrio norvegicus DSM 15893 TaxID=1121869 RepID=A0A1I5S6Y9_9GAMM|nr:hypothetical protein [Enterovibrio norvegicus]SFP66568.1 hypothetical protein SAMN03084138_02806 [Enterovibrio norvegicus DSM 15893]
MSIQLEKQRDAARSQREIIRKQRDTARARIALVDNKYYDPDSLYSVFKEDKLEAKISTINTLFKQKDLESVKVVLKACDILGLKHDFLLEKKLSLKSALGELTCEDSFLEFEELKSSEFNSCKISYFKEKLLLLLRNKNYKDAYSIVNVSLKSIPHYALDVPILYLQTQIKSHGKISHSYFDTLKRLDSEARSLFQITNSSLIMREILKINMLLSKDYDDYITDNVEKQFANSVKEDGNAKLNYYHLTNLKKIVKPESNLKSRKSLKIGILFSGQVRGIEKRKFNINSSKDLLIDTFYHVWDKRGVRVPDNLALSHYRRVFSEDFCNQIKNFNLWGDVLYCRYPSIYKQLCSTEKISEDVITSDKIYVNDLICNDKRSIKILDEDKVQLQLLEENKETNWKNQVNQLKMFYGMCSSFNSIEENIDEYDLIIRCRPDLDMNIDLDEILENLNNELVLDVFRWDDCGDRFALGIPSSMKLYNNFYSQLDEYIPSKKVCCPNPKPHASFFYYLFYNGIQLVKSPFITAGEMNSFIIDNESVLGLIHSDLSLRNNDHIDNKIVNFLSS